MSQAEGTRAESIEEQERDRAADKKPKSRRPANTAFRQQRLKAWQPILTPKSVLPLFFIVGILFAPIGGVLLWASAQVQEIVIDYTNCQTEAPTGSFGDLSKYVSTTWKAKSGTPPSWQKTWNSTGQNWICTLEFNIPESMGPPVYMYYRLTNFYQNHRRYVQSLDLDQLKGTPVSNSTIAGSVCSPLATSDSGKAYYPCGLIANSMFNDTIGQPILTGDSSETYNMTTKGIAWQSDKDLIKTTKYKPGEVDPPPNWVGYNYTESIPDLHENEEFMVWMRTAGLPAFSKLSRRNDDDAMKPGRYELSINYRFNVTEYAGTKSILLSTRTALGGKNPFMGIAYVVVGGVCVLLGALFTVAHLVRPRKLGDHTYLTWDSTNQPSTATATGRDDRMRAGA
ncbi:JAB1/Mov34/MPN/PAD-1 [Penicillium atrosanguineum]|uniref:Meiotically protein n=1 Tax=Penicillium atrosanguineum TaxID=1132637 RepID=A0A9W9PND2_9EURO|nr:JAB1/Mov34/MPN/PAD-1 [Penicillium atrosanguineum]KAJ5293318.1 JAB1/Mov34/MPN/PAD-1 [Penicillium atrosanguineum]KAJ5302650.1 Meiotically protein [Penicillium atrosanguineum]